MRKEGPFFLKCYFLTLCILTKERRRKNGGPLDRGKLTNFLCYDYVTYYFLWVKKEKVAIDKEGRTWYNDARGNCICRFFAGIAQSVEQLIRNQQVACSSHVSSSKPRQDLLAGLLRPEAGKGELLVKSSAPALYILQRLCYGKLRKIG